MAKTITIKSVTDLVTQFSTGKLVGYKPAEEVDTNSFIYPVKFKLDEEAKTFTVVKTETPKEETKTEDTTSTTDTTKVEVSASTSSKKKLSKGAIAGIVIGVLALIGVITGIIIAVI